MTDVTGSLELIKRGTEEVLPEDLLIKKLQRGKPLKIKAGFDPTAPDLHLGHTVLINKLRQFQELGHEVIFLIGDFTGMIGDPTGKSATRPPLTRDEVVENAKTYEHQIFKILDPTKTTVLFNSSWMGEMSAVDLIQLAAKHTVARMLERDDFNKRYTSGQAIAVHEFLYPLIQGYDSVVLKADVELGGTDQKFNLLVGRQLQEAYQQEPQIVITLPILEGLDGVQKMSKSLNNYIGITDAPEEMFGKVMSISDELMWRYFELLSFRPMSEIVEWKREIEQGANPRDVKIRLAEELVERFHSREQAVKAHEAFVARFQKGQMPDEMAEFDFTASNGGYPIANLLKDAELVKSTSEAMRMIKQGAVRIDGERVTDHTLTVAAGSTHVYQVGKRRFARVSLH
ncbi:MAG: tyrosine--tRNA ligase [Candidatus Thiodiazotropha endolucinida]|uniref:Tyrosine--tRNA ligase n=2 Tax=Candidatus Thiodiazotropha TaxID=1913444 RepID=A0A7Z0VKX1_9GAMM|nr:tyrosine--tRNA ligase [Candidatus Thiodiazotropha endolucinida]MBT3042718.1 tyrosine--tRNA ligase [Candidatus Thiodiazotropha sp. (ex Codakia orbicularis)]MCG7875291.1 tyrosine--tRNA ligase [Candidatus Thiodiazotropha taylori]MCG7884377.1 tyrosine--tRNA ligase [Candidatus Thiodiazotropha taylori]MCG7887664.1 tyrosine--tRNA ligase [Candidatus Thiodiazotropha taylori]MCG7889155.1 tyrosine--tRNA ligase [Candidatus Thiodiazotropha taylori]